MIRFSSLAEQGVAEILTDGGIGVVRTDTIYGVIALAANKEAVEKAYQAKGRTPSKQPIILIADRSQLFEAAPAYVEDFMKEVWPGRVSLIVPTTSAPEWLLRGGNSLAYRLPANDEISSLVAKVGPLIAPSANPEGMKPASTIEEAIEYFGDSVDFFVDGGKITDNSPSRLYILKEGEAPERLR